MNPFPQHEWVKSSYSNQDGGNCVEWAPSYVAATGVVPVRDSKAAAGPVLLVTRDAWSSFLAFAAR
ncbi:DUF397 domain-containing protein [Streptomyces sp. NPDC006645]|uniref:DUF397 domain-containing protein n=1 Tax=unclassified Streptomyces TaxID=2593676 RepID=UPI0033B03D35